jgi:histidine kinase
VQTLYGYHVREKLYSSGNKTILRVRRQLDAREGVLKFFDTDARSNAELERIKNEFNCLKAVNSQHVIRVHDLVFFERGVGILMDDFRGESLALVLARKQKFDIPSFLGIAIKLTRGLADIHREKVIHRDLKPSNVLFDEGSGQLKIIDFGISKAFSMSRAGEQMGSLPYMSPEQTGKMNRTVDLRSDLYSLGVLFFELLTGRRPFVSKDPLELVHWHIAKTPDSPSDLDPAIPEALSAIVLKLLRKETETRYQSAAGLLHDLEACGSYVESGQEIPAGLPIGARDAPQIFRIPEKLYGRQHELSRLLDAFTKAKGGAFEPVLVCGYSGIGKSALIHEVQKPLVAARGSFAAGKYDQFNKAKPYSAIQEALGEAVRSVLRQPEEEIQRWREEILRALAAEGQCLIEVIPMLETLIGPQPELADAGPVSRQNRFIRNCEALLSVFASADHPLVLFLDDVQWADAASIELVRAWIESKIPHMMLILAYRDNEVGAHHPLSLMLRASLGAHFDTCRIQLSSIEQSSVEELVSDTLRRTIHDVRDLAAVHVSKTGGNPFFLIQMFRGLYEDGLISFADDGWTWTLDEITTRNLTDNVVELMTRKLHRYNEETRGALNMCAMLGAEFELGTLAIVLRTRAEKAYRAVFSAIEDGLLTEANGRLKFAHDKIHEAAYGLVAEDERKRRHRLVGRYLFETLDDAARENQLFKIVDDLNRSRELVRDEAERKELVRLNIRAGQKALSSSAFLPAIELFENAISLFQGDPWRDNHGIAFDAYFGLASADYACARYDACERNLNICLAHVDDPVRNAPAVQLLLGALFSQNRHDESVRIGLARLAILGVKISARPTKPQVLAAYAMFKLRQGFRSTESLVDLPPATDKRAIAAVGILSALIPSAYMVSADLYGVVAMKTGQLSLRYGNTVLTPFAYAACMVTEAGVFKAIRSGEAYLKLAYAVNEKYPHAQQRGRLELIRNVAAIHQTGSLEGWEGQAMAAVAYNIDAGAPQFADYTLAMTRAQSIFFGTRSLDDVYRANSEVLALHRKHGDQEVIANQLFILHTLARWRDAKGSLNEELDPEIDNFDIEAYARKLAQPGNIVPRGFFAMLKQAQQYFDGDYTGSLRTGLAFKLQAIDLLGIVVEHMHRFLYMLAYLAADHSALDAGERVIAAGYYRVNRALFSVFDRNAPNYRSHVALIAAEEKRNRGNTVAALRFYEQAAALARGVSSFSEALAYQRLAAFHRSRGLDLQAGLVARHAFILYRALGFRTEVARLERAFPELMTGYGTDGSSRPKRVSNSPGSSTTMFTQRLDLESLARGAQAISSQVRLDGLVEALLRQLCQSSAARRVVLLLHEEGALWIQGEITVFEDRTELKVLESRPFPAKRGTPSVVAETLVQFVGRVKRTEVLDDAVNEGDFARDPYVEEHKVKSIVSMPILNQGKLLGVLYLENPTVANAFTPRHTEVLEVLSSQAAISFENARLYRSLEQKVEERTTELRGKTNDLASMLQNLEQGVFTILRDGTIHREYSRQLEAILGTRLIAGRNYDEVLFEGSTLSADVISQIKAAVLYSVGAKLLWYESNRHLLVSEMRRRRPDGALSILELNWSAILADGVVEKLLVSVKDVTELRHLEQQAEEQRRDLEMIGQILALPRSTYLAFMRDTEKLIKRSELAIASSSLDPEGLAFLFAAMHTIKGNARTYGFSFLAHSAHDAEETYAACRSLPSEAWDTARIQSELALVRKCLERYGEVYEHNLASFVGLTGQRAAVDDELLEQMREAVRARRPEALPSLIDALGTTTLEEIVATASAGALEMARKLDKPAPSIRVESAQVRFRQEIVSVLRDVFVHLLRNALDHGIEVPAERRARNKPEAGDISFTARVSSAGCELRVRDDGRGLPIAKLRVIAEQEGLQDASDAQIAQIVFRSGVSTAESVSETSGRGVGMDAIRRFIAERGGDVHLELAQEGESYRPFTTCIVLPPHYVVQFHVNGARA